MLRRNLMDGFCVAFILCWVIVPPVILGQLAQVSAMIPLFIWGLIWLFVGVYILENEHA